MEAALSRSFESASSPVRPAIGPDAVAAFAASLTGPSSCPATSRTSPPAKSTTPASTVTRRSS